jgi:MurNAc alpha-1-phosphate uridylyltransferase
VNTIDQVLLFAAGRGERMLPLTRDTPKPLLVAGGRRLIEWHLEALARAGFGRVVVNIAHLADRFEPALGDGSRYGLHIAWSHEGAEPLETGGGMLHALDLLGDGPYAAVNADIWTDFDYAWLRTAPAGLADLVLVDNPAHHPCGDFHLDDAGRVHADGTPRLTFAGIGRYRPALLDDWQAAFATPVAEVDGRPKFPLAPLLRRAMATSQVTGHHHRGRWTDVGTPERLAALDAALAGDTPA